MADYKQPPWLAVLDKDPLIEHHKFLDEWIRSVTDQMLDESSVTLRVELRILRRVREFYIKALKDAGIAL